MPKNYYALQRDLLDIGPEVGKQRRFTPQGPSLGKSSASFPPERLESVPRGTQWGFLLWGASQNGLAISPTAGNPEAKGWAWANARRDTRNSVPRGTLLQTVG